MLHWGFMSDWKLYARLIIISQTGGLYATLGIISQTGDFYVRLGIHKSDWGFLRQIWNL